MFVLCTIVLPVVAWRPGSPLNVNLAARLMTTISGPLYGIKWEFVGYEHLGGSEPCIVVGNHQSTLDVLGMMVVWPHLKRCVSMVKSELRYALSFGALCYLCGTVFIDRYNPEKARDTINGTVAYLRRKNTKVYIFPEGTRNSGSDMLHFKKGAFHLAVQGQMSVLPVVFSEYSNVYSYEKKVFEPGTITVTALPPVSTIGLTADDVTDLSQRVRQLMLDVLQGKASRTQSAVDNVGS